MRGKQSNTKNDEQFNLTKFILRSDLAKKFKLKSTDTLVLAGLSTYYNKRNEFIFPSYNTLSRTLHISRTTAINAIKRLEKTGIIIKECIKKASSKYNPTNHYKFTFMFMEIFKEYTKGLEKRGSQENFENFIEEEEDEDDTGY
jgi:predicted transcriptional regulator